MNVKKLLRAYMAFVLGITAMGGAYQATPVRSYVSTNLASVMHIIDSVGDSENFKYVAKKDSSYGTGSGSQYLTSVASLETAAKKKMIEKGSQDNIELSFLNSVDDGYAAPGEEAVSIMRLEVSAKDKSVELDNLRLKISGVSADLVEDVFLWNELGETISANKSGEYVSFKNIDLELEDEESAVIDLRISLSPEMKTGNRVRMDIESAEDIGLWVEGQRQEYVAKYPLRGKYLSVAKPRPWSESYGSYKVIDDYESKMTDYSI